MKKIKLLTTALFSLMAGSMLYAQCNASGIVTQTGNPGEIIITDNSTTASGPGATFSYIDFYSSPNWQYVGGIALQPNSTTSNYTFTQNGTYNYYLQVEDSLTGCFDSIGGSITITGLANCDASFSYFLDSNVINGIDFTSTGTNSGTAVYSWNFGDGTNGSGLNTSHIYNNPGAYAVCLVVSDSANGGCAQTYCDSVTVGGPSGCSASSNVFVNQTGTPGLVSIVDNSSSSTSTSVSWMAFYNQSGTWLGDVQLQPTSTTGTFQLPSNGLYYYSFVVQDATGTCEDSISSLLTINNFATSSCDANYNFYLDSVGGVYFDAPTQTGSGYSYFWDFGDGNTSNIADPTHTYGSNGTFTACLTVWNNATSCSDTVCNTITIIGASGSGSGCAGNSMFTYSFNNGNEAFFIPVNVLSNATYQWSFGDGTSGFNAVEQHTYNVATSGWYAVCLTTINANNCTDYYCDSVYVTVPTSGPSCDAQFYSYSDSTIANMVYFYNYGNNAATANYFWNFGDGATGSGMYPTHTYATSGWYAVCLTVSDNSGSGCTQTYCDSVYADGGVVSPSCNASFILFQDSTGSGVYYAWNTSVGSGLSYYWDFGDGNTSTLAYPTHTYSAVGSYTICLTVYNNNGCSSTYCDNIVIVVKAAGTTLNVLQPGATVGVEEIALINEAKLYPNPNNGQFNMSINVSQSMDAVLNITNLMGQTVEVITLQLNQGENVINFDQSHLTSGIYLVNLIDEQTGSNSTLKLIKE